MTNKLIIQFDKSANQVLMKFIYTPKRKSTGSKYLNSFKAFLETNNKDFTQMT